MLKLIDLLLLAFLLLCLSGLRVSTKKHPLQEDVMGRRQTAALRGMLCILILFHHSALLTGSGLSVGGLKRIGAYVVGLFYALSGYGLMASWEKNGLRGFWGKRFRGTILPYLVLSAAAILIRLVIGETLTVREILLSFVNGKPLIRYSWFILAILLYYVLFWASGLIAKNDEALLIVLSSVGVFFLGFVLKAAGMSEYWYNAGWCFPLGLIWRSRQPFIQGAFARHSGIYLLLAGAVSLWWIVIAEHFFWFDYIARLFSTLSVTVFILLLMLRLRNENPVLRFLGGISMEIYLIHGLIVTVLLCLLSPEDQPTLFLALLFPVTILLAWLFHLGVKCLARKKQY